MVETDSAPLSLTEKIGYGAGDMASNFYMGVINVFLLYYYTDVWGIEPAAAAFMFLITKVIDAVSDPCMGLIADRTKVGDATDPTCCGGPSPQDCWATCCFLDPTCPKAANWRSRILYTLVMLAYTAINVPYSALLAVISPVAEERTKATQKPLLHPWAPCWWGPPPVLWSITWAAATRSWVFDDDGLVRGHIGRPILVYVCQYT